MRRSSRCRSLNLAGAFSSTMINIPSVMTMMNIKRSVQRQSYIRLYSLYMEVNEMKTRKRSYLRSGQILIMAVMTMMLMVACTKEVPGSVSVQQNRSTSATPSAGEAGNASEMPPPARESLRKAFHSEEQSHHQVKQEVEPPAGSPTMIRLKRFSTCMRRFRLTILHRISVMLTLRVSVCPRHAEGAVRRGRQT